MPLKCYELEPNRRLGGKFPLTEVRHSDQKLAMKDADYVWCGHKSNYHLPSLHPRPLRGGLRFLSDGRHPFFVPEVDGGRSYRTLLL